MPSDITQIRNVEEEPVAQLGLNAEVVVVVVDALYFRVRIDAADGALRTDRGHGSSRGVREIAILELHLRGIGGQRGEREYEVALRAIVEGSKSAAHGELASG